MHLTLRDELLIRTRTFHERFIHIHGLIPRLDVRETVLRLS